MTYACIISVTLLLSVVLDRLTAAYVLGD